MAHAVSMPSLGMTMEEGTVIEWPVALGEPVAKGDVVLVIESEKSEVDVEAPAAGILRHIYVQVGETVPCGTLLAVLTESADEPFDAEVFRAAEDRPRGAARGGLQVRTVAPAAAEPRAERPVAPAARAAARKLGIDPQRVPGSGPNGRVTKQDVEAFAAARESLTPVGDGVSLEVLREGRGDPVVLLPGLGTDVSAFTRQMPVLAQRFRVHAVNPRGVGLSDAPQTAAYEVAQSAADAAACYEGEAHLIGASLGAAVALELAITRPERVRSLTLITPFVTMHPRLVAVGRAWQRVADDASPETLAAMLLPWFFSASFLADEVASARIVRGLAQSLARVPASSLARARAGMETWSGSRAGDLASLAVPTLVVAAGEDLLSPDAAAIADAIPKARLVTLEGAGHAVALEAADAVNEAILARIAL